MALECYQVSENRRWSKVLAISNTEKAFLTQLIDDCCTPTGGPAVIGMATGAATEVLRNEGKKAFVEISKLFKQRHLRDLQFLFLRSMIFRRW